MWMLTTCAVEPPRITGDSPFGVHDMAGNVAEWSADWFTFSNSAFWSAATVQNPLCGDSCPDQLRERVVRNGCWHLDELHFLRSASRYYGRPMDRSDGVGFRCARDLP